MKRPHSLPSNAVHAAGWLARLAVELLELGALAGAAMVAHFGAKTARRVNRKGLLGWGTVALIVLFVTATLIELVELV